MSAPTLERGPAADGHRPGANGRHVQGAPLAATAAPAGLRVGVREWALVPAVAVVAYLTSLRVGFLSDDFVLMFETSQHGVHWIPLPWELFYRPVGLLLSWGLPWELWGTNPLPYHVIGLLAHAGVCLLLGLWLAEITRRQTLGWLAGALFGVFPLHTEAVAWVSAQWDVLAALFGMSSLLLFTLWWGRSGAALYAGALALFVVGLYTKESLLTWIPLYVLTVWFTSPKLDGKAWRRLGMALLPFGAVLALNIVVRLVVWGRLGGYLASTDYGKFFWTGLLDRVRALVSPINVLVLGPETQQIVGAVVSLLLLLGLMRYGWRYRRLLAVAAGWVTLALVPVLNYPFDPNDLRNNRYLYVAAIGYCVGVAVLLHAALATGWRRRRIALPVVGVLLLLGVAACWAQLRPWHTATVQVEEIGRELRRLIPPQPHPDDLVWHVENVPIHYKGAHVLLLGMDRLRFYTGGELLQYKATQSAAQIDVAGDPRGRDVFAMRFYYDDAETRFHVDYAAGMTANTPPPAQTEGSDGLKVWDFRDCSPAVLNSWQAHQAEPTCAAGEGLELRRPGEDQQITAQGLNLDAGSTGARFVRVRVSATYREGEGEGAGPYVSEWFWAGEGQGMSGDRSSSLPIKRDGKPHVYWTFIPAAQLDRPITTLRFDAANKAVPASIGWIAVDLVR